MKWKNQILNLEAYKPGKSIDAVKKQYRLKKIAKLASNENPYGYSTMVDQALENFKTSFILYPDGNASNLRQATASLLDVDPSQLIFTNGTDELIQIISRSLLEPGKNTVMANPTFSQYKHNAVIEGAEVREVDLIDGSHDLKGMLQQVDECTAIIWICSPNNPTGLYIPEGELVSFLEGVPRDVLVVLDEAYHEYVSKDIVYNSIPLVDKYPNLIVMRTFSKIYGLASFRVGYGVSSINNIKYLEPARPPFNTNVLGQLAATAAIKDQDFIDNCRIKNEVEKQKYYDFCQENQLKYYPTQGNFILIDFSCDGDEVSQFLLSKGIIARSGKSLGFPMGVRITLGLEEQNQQVRNTIIEFLEQKS